MPITKPGQDEYAPYYHTYIGKVTQSNLLDALNATGNKFIEFLKSVPAEKHDYRYAEGKWTVKEVVSHVIDCERIFVYRALTFARGDKNALPGFDENEYVPQSNAGNRTMEGLINEYEQQRKSSILFFEGITEEMSLRTGRANNNEISVRALGFILSGHELHHQGVIKERYL